MQGLCIWQAVSWRHCGNDRREDEQMINFEEELKKFKPSLEIDQAEEAIYKNDLRDVTDILEDMMKELKAAAGSKRF